MSRASTQSRGDRAAMDSEGEAFLIVTPTLLPHLRKGLLVELGFAADMLSQLTLRGDVADRHAYESATWRIDAARKLLGRVGVSATGLGDAVELSFDDHPFVVYRALREQLELAVVRGESEAVEGRAARAVVDGELESVVAMLRALLARSSGAMREARSYGHIAETQIIAPRGKRPRISSPDR
jgi:hypothetical protein